MSFFDFLCMPGDTIQTYTNYIHVRLNVSAAMLIEALEEQTRLQTRLDGVLEDRAEAQTKTVGCF